MLLSGVVSPLCATRWENSGKSSPSVDMHRSRCVHSTSAQFTARTVQDTHTCTVRPTLSGQSRPSALGKPRPCCTAVICAAIPASRAYQRELCCSHAAEAGPGPTPVRKRPCPTPTSRPHTPQALQAPLGRQGGAPGCGRPRGDDAAAGGQEEGGREAVREGGARDGRCRRCRAVPRCAAGHRRRCPSAAVSSRPPRHRHGRGGGFQRRVSGAAAG